VPSKLPTEEQEIAKRLGQFRCEKLMTRAALAKELGVTRDRLTSYELARVPLRADVALKLWRKFEVSPAWLATGKGHRSLPRGLYDDLNPEADPRETLSAFHSRFLGAQLESEESKRRQAFHSLISFVDFLADSARAGVFNEREKELLLDFSDSVVKSLREKRLEKEVLALSSDKVPTASVPPHTSRLAELLKRARVATAARGAQSQLAEFLGARRQHVHRWLSGAQEPGGETTLRLLEWVTMAEASQSKDGGRVAPRPPRKTQTKLNTTNAKKGSGPPRK
jgi:transcriptional regulator with XRE-family HTH domain